jgi:drug/metabolite transporter (DMT)-like permease
MDQGIGYAVVAAVVWGVYLFYLKQSFRGYTASTLTVLINIFALGWYLPIFGVSVGFSNAVDALSGFGLDDVGILALTVVTIAGAMIAFLRALAIGDVSYVAPINKIVPVFVLPIEVLFLGQFLTSLQVTGVLVATVAIYVANFQGGSLLEPLRRAASSRAAQLALLSAVFFAVSDVGKRVALQELAIPTGLWVPLLFGGVIIVLLPSVLRSPPTTIRSDLPQFVVAGGFVAVGEYITTLAFSLIPASIASPIINAQAVVAVVLGGVLLNEQYFGVRAIAAVLAVVGVTLIAI